VDAMRVAFWVVNAAGVRRRIALRIGGWNGFFGDLDLEIAVRCETPLRTGGASCKLFHSLVISAGFPFCELLPRLQTDSAERCGALAAAAFLGAVLYPVLHFHSCRFTHVTVDVPWAARRGAFR